MHKDYEWARQYARWVGWVRLLMFSSGGVIFIVGVIIAVLGYRDIGLIGVGSGVIAGTLGKLLTPIARDADRRLSQFHKELALFYQQDTKKRLIRPARLFYSLIMTRIFWRLGQSSLRGKAIEL